MNCEHITWMQRQSYLNEPWQCTECGLRLTASEYLIYTEARTLRRMMTAQQNKLQLLPIETTVGIGWVNSGAHHEAWLRDDVSLRHLSLLGSIDTNSNEDLQKWEWAMRDKYMKTIVGE